MIFIKIRKKVGKIKIIDDISKFVNSKIKKNASALNIKLSFFKKEFSKLTLILFNEIKIL